MGSLSTSKEWQNLLVPYLVDNNTAAVNLAQNELVHKLILDGKTIYHFGFGQSPFPVLKSAQKALTENTEKNAYLPVAGIPELRKSICEFHVKLDNLRHIEADDIVIGPGSKELIFLLMLVFNGDVMLLSPTWTTYKPQSLLAHKSLHIIPTSYDNSWKLTPEALLQTIKENNLENTNKLLIFCNPDNPTGTCYTEKEIESLSNVLQDNQVIVLSDEIYSRLRFDGNHVSLAKYYPEGTIVSSGISKWASGGGWRLGYNIFPKQLSVLKTAVCAAASNTYTCVSAPIQYASMVFFDFSEETQDYLFHCRRIMSVVADYCCRELTSVGIKVRNSQGGYYLMPDFEILRPYLKKRRILTCPEMCNALFEEAHVAVISAGPAFLRPVDEFTVRFCYVLFDGEAALAASSKIGKKEELTEKFVIENCPNIVDGVQAIKNWVKTQMRN